MKISDILCQQKISSKYTKFDEYENKKIIEKIYKVKKEMKLIKILELTFEELFIIFRRKLNDPDDMNKLEEIKDKIKGLDLLKENNKYKDIEYLLTDGDLKKALSNYADSYGYDLDNFQYIGDINKTGYYFGEDTLNYEGIELKVTHREKNEEDVKKLVKTKKELK